MQKSKVVRIFGIETFFAGSTIFVWRPSNALFYMAISYVRAAQQICVFLFETFKDFAANHFLSDKGCSSNIFSI